MEDIKILNNKNKYGQYFTPRSIAKFMISLSSKNKKANVLEPCVGEGIFLEELVKSGYENVNGYEIDTNLKYDNKYNVKYDSYLNAKKENGFDLIIGNPPYIRWKNLENELKEELENNLLWKQYCNSLCDYYYIFIIKSIELLNDNGELIFICPDYWLKTTNAQKMRNYILDHGHFEEIFLLNESPVFKNVTCSLMIFKFVKNIYVNKNINITKLSKKFKLGSNEMTDLLSQTKNKNIDYYSINQFSKHNKYHIANQYNIDLANKFESICKYKKDGSLFEKSSIIGDICNVKNGLVTGLDKAFQLPIGINLNKKEKKIITKVAKGKNLSSYIIKDLSNYIFFTKKMKEEELIDDYPNIFKHFSNYKSKLLDRYSYDKDIPYWEWVFLRNYNTFIKKEPKILVPCKERITNKDYFRFALSLNGEFPTQDVTSIIPKSNTLESIYYILSLLNSNVIFNWITTKGTQKGGVIEFVSKTLQEIPIPLIDWNNSKEVNIHNEISDYLKKQIDNKLEIDKNFIEKCIGKLLIIKE